MTGGGTALVRFNIGAVESSNGTLEPQASTLTMTKILRGPRLRLLPDLGVDVALVQLCSWVTFTLAFNHSARITAIYLPLYVWAIVDVLVALILIGRSTYTTSPRYLGMHDFIGLAYTATAITVVCVCAFVIAGPHAAIRTFLLAALLLVNLNTAALFGVRIVRRAAAIGARDAKKEGTDQGPRRSLIVGAGDAGEIILRELIRDRSGATAVVGFADDSPDKRGLRIHGVPVLGKTDAIPQLVEQYRVDEILIALPAATGKNITRIYELCSRTRARVRTLPGLNAVLRRENLHKHLREIEVEDLLRRDPVVTDFDSVARYLSGARVMITGAGGSIGSELARQVATMCPESLILLGRGENSIFEIEQELIHAKSITPVTVIADVRDRVALANAFVQFRPTVIFHTAAHKHVPLMEQNPIEAVQNNIIGTLNAAELAAEYNASHFILISTDKAVNPSSVMGATKRVCEMIVSDIADTTECSFSAVRFGNVLGSRGSLIPLLRSQIRRGGPVTITHKDMTRFFMTIPEAAALVMQAGAMGKRGEIFILDMGEPIVIRELAFQLIRLHGLMPGEEIEVAYIGMRPGEKLHEELSYSKESLVATAHSKIGVINDVHKRQHSAFRHDLDVLTGSCASGNQQEIRRLLMLLATKDRD